MTDTLPTRRRRVTLSHVAREAGVAVSTASAILRGEVTSWASQETRQRVMDAAAKVQYRPNQLARSLRSQETRLIGMVFTSLEVNPVALAKFAEAERRAIEAGYQVLIRNHHGKTSDDSSNQLATLLSYQVAGIILMPGTETTSQLQWLASTGIPTVTIDAADARYGPNVMVDRAHGGYLQVRHMLQDVGCKRLAFLVPGRNRDPIDPTYSKLVGIRRALKELGSSEQEHLFFDGPQGSDHGYAFGRSVMLKLIESGEPFDGVVAISDAVALTAMHTLEHEGFKVPDDVAVIGFDDQSFTPHLAVPLSTIRQPTHVGRIAMEMLLDQIRQEKPAAERPENRLIEPELIVRRSTLPSVQHGAESGAGHASSSETGR